MFCGLLTSCLPWFLILTYMYEQDVSSEMFVQSTSTGRGRYYLLLGTVLKHGRGVLAGRSQLSECEVKCHLGPQRVRARRVEGRHAQADGYVMYECVKLVGKGKVRTTLPQAYVHLYEMIQTRESGNRNRSSGMGIRMCPGPWIPKVPKAFRLCSPLCCAAKGRMLALQVQPPGWCPGTRERSTPGLRKGGSLAMCAGVYCVFSVVLDGLDRRFSLYCRVSPVSFTKVASRQETRLAAKSS